MALPFGVVRIWCRNRCTGMPANAPGLTACCHAGNDGNHKRDRWHISYGQAEWRPDVLDVQQPVTACCSRRQPAEVPGSTLSQWNTASNGVPASMPWRYSSCCMCGEQPAPKDVRLSAGPTHQRLACQTRTVGTCIAPA
jgi:hypothetical protein